MSCQVGGKACCVSAVHDMCITEFTNSFRHVQLCFSLQSKKYKMCPHFWLKMRWQRFYRHIFLQVIQLSKLSAVLRFLFKSLIGSWRKTFRPLLEKSDRKKIDLKIIKQKIETLMRTKFFSHPYHLVYKVKQWSDSLVVWFLILFLLLRLKSNYRLIVKQLSLKHWRGFPGESHLMRMAAGVVLNH